MTIVFDEFELDPARRELRVEGKAQPLQPQVFDLLLYLVENHERVVPSSWVPTAEFVNEEGIVAPEFICAALDCPGAWALIGRYEIDGPVVLGRMTFRLQKPIYAGERYVVQGWATGREGRKAFCGTAIYDADGAVCAAAGATWIQIG